MEKDLEFNLLEHISEFLLELGRGFSFVARQRRIDVDGDNFYIDLVFYNYVLKCFVLIDLKLDKLTHQDIGQMDFYVRYFDNEIKDECDNPTIGIILCSDKKDTIVKYSVLNDNKNLFASKYQLYLPTEKELALEIEKQKAEFNDNKNWNGFTCRTKEIKYMKEGFEVNLNWNLENLFKNNQDFYMEIENIKNMATDIKKYENEELDEISLYDILNAKWKIKELTNNVLIYGSLMYYKNVKSDECIELKSVAETFNNQVNAELGFIDRKILNLGKEKVEYFISKNSKLYIYKLFLDNLFRMQEHIQDNIINNKIKSNIDNINYELKLYNNALRDIKYGTIEINGERIEITSSNFAKYISSRNREIRKQTYLTFNQNFKDLEY